MADMPHLENVIFEAAAAEEKRIEDALDCDVIYYNGPIRSALFDWFRDTVEKVAAGEHKKDALGIVLTTSGGEVEIVEKMVNVIRHHYSFLHAIVPEMAMSAGTILCMAADKIYMDYSSSLGPVDPQVPDKDQTSLVPALGYLDKIDEFIEKSRNGTITPVEFQIVMNQDIATLRFYEQAKELSQSLMKNWLVKYKFKDWDKHRTTNPGADVTHDEKVERATEIAEILATNSRWHSHSRYIGMKTLRDELRLEIEDFGGNDALRVSVKRYYDMLTRYLSMNGMPAYIHNRNTQ